MEPIAVRRKQLVIIKKPNILHDFANITKGIPWHFLGTIAEWLAIAGVAGATLMSAMIVLRLRQDP